MSKGPHLGCVTVFGGTGFLGGEIVRRLAADGTRVRVAVRHPEKASFGARNDRIGAILPVYANVCDRSSVAAALEGATAAVNAVGRYVETGVESFEAVHEQGAATVAQQCAALGVGRLVHISGIGADPQSESRYVRARAKGEALVSQAFAQATILRPSVLFGPEDAFLNSLAQIVRRTPVLPLFGQGRTRLQPVYVGDVAEAVLRALQRPVAVGRIYELGGPRVYSYRALIELVLHKMNRHCLLLPVPFPLWDRLAACASLLPRPPLTRAQVTLMKRDNLVGEAALSLADLGVEATALEEILPRYGI